MMNNPEAGLSAIERFQFLTYSVMMALYCAATFLVAGELISLAAHQYDA